MVSFEENNWEVYELELTFTSTTAKSACFGQIKKQSSSSSSSGSDSMIINSLSSISTE